MTSAAGKATRWSVEAQPFLKTILDCVAQPVWVVDHAGLIRFANPTAIATLWISPNSKAGPATRRSTTSAPTGPTSPPRSAQCSCHEEPAKRSIATRTGSSDATERRSPWPTGRRRSTRHGRGAVVAFTDIQEQRIAEQAERERDVARARESEARAGQRRIVEAGYEARRQVTRDLHDGAQQKLINLALKLELAREVTVSDPARASQLLDNVMQQTRAAINHLRDLAAGIHPRLLTTRGLAAAIEGLADQLSLPVAPMEIPEERFAPPIEATVYSLVSEALTNIVKHAHASHAEVRIAVHANRLTVEVRDDGIGRAQTEPPGHGLAGMADRVNALEGTLTVDSRPSAGTRVRAEIPLTS